MFYRHSVNAFMQMKFDSASLSFRPYVRRRKGKIRLLTKDLFLSLLEFKNSDKTLGNLFRNWIEIESFYL
jgi:hypothetical protein